MKNKQIGMVAVVVGLLFSMILGGCGSSDKPIDSGTSGTEQTQGSGQADTSTGETMDSIETGVTTAAGTADSSLATNKTATKTTKKGDTADTLYRPPVEGIVTKPTVKPAKTPENFYKSIRGTTVRVYRSVAAGDLEKVTTDAFEKKYGCTVKWVVVGWQQWKQRLLQGVAAGAPADYTIYYDNQFANYVANKVLQPVDKYVYAADPFWDKDVMSMFAWNGKNYGFCNTLGSDLNVGMIYYNKTMFEDAGEKEPIDYYKEGKWTFDTFEKVAKRMTVDSDSDGTTDIYGFATWWLDWSLLANGNRLVKQNADGSVSLTLKEKSAYNALQLQANLAKSKSYLYNDQWADFFKAKHVAMIFERPFNAVGSLYLLDSKVFKDEIGICPPPKGPDAKVNYAPALFDTVGIPTGADNPLGAAAYYYFTRQYDFDHRGDPIQLANRRRCMTVEHEKIINDYLKKSVKINTIASSFGKWDNVKGQLWADILQKGISPSAAVDARYDQLKYEITDTMRAMKK